jgi:uncharacterized protein YyaL (SSP411 family)
MKPPVKLATILTMTALLWRADSCCLAQTAAESATQFERWGTETLQAIHRDLWIGVRGLYAEKATTSGAVPLEPAFMWGAGVQLSALAAAARVDRATYTAPLTEYADALQVYWVDHAGLGGYDVLPNQRAPDRYYDDNAWIVLGLLETFAITRDKKHFDRAAATMRFVLSGEDDALDGGIYWRENTVDSNNTCINAPAIVAALLLYQETKDPQYLKTAERLNIWTRSRLQDDRDGLYFDSIRLDGRVDRRKYSYNSAQMIRANCLFYVITGDPKHLAEAERVAQSAAALWIDPESGAVNDAGRFAHMLLEALLEVDRHTSEPRWQSTVRTSLEFVHHNVRDQNGRYASRWDRTLSRPLQTYQLLDQASTARGYLTAAHALDKRGE